MKAVSRSTLWFYGTALGIVVIDQVTKALARSALELDQPVPVIPGLFDLRLNYNSGAAFGVLPNWAPLLIIVALAAIFAIVRLRRAGDGSRVLSTGLAMLLGGATGNLIDRLSGRPPGSDGQVTDFLSFHVRIGGSTYTWPTFNVADVGIVVGAVLVLYFVYVVDRRRPDYGEDRRTAEN